jgi:hypothetical protein
MGPGCLDRVALAGIGADVAAVRVKAIDRSPQLI